MKIVKTANGKKIILSGIVIFIKNKKKQAQKNPFFDGNIGPQDNEPNAKIAKWLSQ
jgi:hypothetical protein